MKTFKKSLIPVIAVVCAGIFSTTNAQVKITDGSDTTMDANSLLELESTNKGFLAPRMAINSLSSPAPLVAPVPAGMLVYSTGGTVCNGFYYWTGTAWSRVISTGTNVMKTKSISTNATLTKTDNIIFASNDITLTLPAITDADTGLTITIKIVGSHTDLVKVAGNSGATMDEMDTVNICGRKSKTFVAHGANWVMLNRENSESLIDIGPHESFLTIQDAIEFLEEHMCMSVVLRLGAEPAVITNTITIDLPYPLTIEGLTYGTGTIEAGTGLAGKPMFRCVSECYFKKLMFEATSLTGYGQSAGEDAIRLVGSGTYHEIKDCTLDRFYNAIIDSSDAELWLFECDISNAQNNGLLIHSPTAGTIIRVAETDFQTCRRGVTFSKGSNVFFTLTSGYFSNLNATDTAIIYRPSAFSFGTLVITNISWNYIGKGIEGFDFTRTDGRDANAFIENNAGANDNKPHCKINVVNNITASTTCAAANTWYKASWTNTSSFTVNYKIEDNKITYQPYKPRDIYIVISGNALVNNNNRNITIGIVKNGVTTTRYGETTLRITSPNQPFQFSTVIYLENVQQNDYFEMYVSSANAGDIVTFQDLNWYVGSN